MNDLLARPDDYPDREHVDLSYWEQDTFMAIITLSSIRAGKEPPARRTQNA